MSVLGPDPVMKTVERAHTRAVTQATLREIALAGAIALLGPLLIAVFGDGLAAGRPARCFRGVRPAGRGLSLVAHAPVPLWCRAAY